MLKFGNTFVNFGGTYLTGWDMLTPYTLRVYTPNGVSHVYIDDVPAESSCTGWDGTRITVAVSGNPGYYLSGYEIEGPGSFNGFTKWGSNKWRGSYTFGEGDCNISAYFSDNVSSQYVFRYQLFTNPLSIDVKINRMSKRPLSAWYGTVGEVYPGGANHPMTDAELDSLTSTNTYFTYSYSNKNDFGIYAIFDSPTTALTLYDNTVFSAGSVSYTLEKDTKVIGGSYTTTLASAKSYWVDNTQSWATHSPIKNVSITANI